MAVLRDFLPFFILLIQPIWAPDKQVKIVSLQHSLLRRELSDSAQPNTARSQTFF